MNIVELNKGSDYLSQVPNPPEYLSEKAKKHFEALAKRLIGAKVLKRIHITSLSVLAENMCQWEWAVAEIASKNNKKQGSGYVQEYKSGAKNISVELTVKRDAEKAIMQCFKQFGLDPKSEKELKIEPNQNNVFEQLKNSLGKTS